MKYLIFALLLVGCAEKVTKMCEKTKIEIQVGDFGASKVEAAVSEACDKVVRK